MARFRLSSVSGVIVVAMAATMLAGCGRRGPLEPPPGAEDPAPPPGTARPAPEEGERPSRPFVLDGLL